MAVSSAGIIQDTLAASDVPLHLDQLVAAVQKELPEKLAAQIYNDAQSLASRGKIGRGTQPRTYVRLANAPSAAERQAQKPTGVKRTARNPGSSRFYPEAEVIQYLTEKLGEPVERPKDRPTYAVSLVGIAPGEYIYNGAVTTLKTNPVAWCRWLVGPTTVVGFLW